MARLSICVRSFKKLLSRGAIGAQKKPDDKGLIKKNGTGYTHPIPLANAPWGGGG